MNTLAKALVVSMFLSTTANPASERVSTAQPFEVGDIWVAASVMNDPEDDHRGIGRLLQYDKDLNLKGELWIDEATHKLGGLKFAPDGTLWAFAQQSWQVFEIGIDGKQKPTRRFANRTFSTVNFGSDGSIFFGEHLVGNQLKIPFNTTVFQYMPYTNRIGDGNIYRFSADGRLLETYEVDTHGGMAGIHGVTNTVLTKDGRMIYCSETGDRIMQYDLENRRQLEDLRVLDPKRGDPSMVLFLSDLSDGTVILGTGRQILLMDPTTGDITKSIDMGSTGWAAVSRSSDPGFLLAGNFFTGEFAKVDINDGEVVAKSNIGEERSLSGISQFPGIQSAIARQHARDVDNQYREVIASSEAAFMRRDIDGAIANLDEDYVLYDIRDEGAVARMRGKAAVEKILGGFFESNTSWVGSEVERLTLIDNILVQIEHDTFETDQGLRTIPTLVVFEHRNGQRWREWRFSPKDR